MFRRIITFTILFLLLATPVTRFPTVSASTLGDRASIEEQCKAKVEAMAEEARKSAVYDQAGRVTRITISVSSHEKRTFNFKYDERNRLQFVVDEDGAQTQFEYDDKGQLRSLLLASGLRMIYERDASGKITDIRRQFPPAKSGQLSGSNHHRIRLVRNSLVVGGACDQAVKQATMAVIAAAGVCGATGVLNPACAAALATAAYLTYLAKQACSNQQADESDAIV